MLALRRYLAARQARDTRGDYDAVPLSELGTAHSDSTPPIPHHHHESSLTLRRAIITILSTLTGLTGLVFLCSLLDGGSNLKLPVIDPSEHTLRIAGNGGFYRDAYPIRSMLKYWDIAEREVKERGLDTCDGQLGRELINAHVRTTVAYCRPPVSSRSFARDF
jgi:hypothetical protein